MLRNIYLGTENLGSLRIVSVLTNQNVNEKIKTKYKVLLNEN